MRSGTRKRGYRSADSWNGYIASVGRCRESAAAGKQKGKQEMLPTKIIERFIEATDLPALRIAFAKLCASAGEAELIEVFLYGSYGNFSAFCTVKMKTQSAEEALLKRYGFQQ